MALAKTEGEVYEKVFAIGDVHGCAKELNLLLQRLPLSNKSLVVFLGDYIDRGSDSRQVVDIILACQKIYNVVALKGNHEAMLFDFLNDSESANAGMFILNGGSATLASYSDKSGRYEIPKTHLDFFNSLKMTYETKNFFFVHAGLPEVPLSKIDYRKHENDMLWVRQPFLASKFKWEKVIVHGHTPVEDVEILPNRINVDTGCVFNRFLSAIELPKKKVYKIAKQAETEQIFLKDPGSNRIAQRFVGHIPVNIEWQGKVVPMETQDYNEFGFLLREIGSASRLLFTVDDKIAGTIGTAKKNQVRFKGIVVRIEKKSDGFYYGVRIQSPLKLQK